MVYKIGNLADLETLPLISDVALELLYHHAKIIETEYGKNRDESSDGGYVLYATSGTSIEELNTLFDISAHTPEWVNRYGDLCEAVYLITNETVVVVIMDISTAPSTLLNQIEN